METIYETTKFGRFEFKFFCEDLNDRKTEKVLVELREPIYDAKIPADHWSFAATKEAQKIIKMYTGMSFALLKCNDDRFVKFTEITFVDKILGSIVEPKTDLKENKLSEHISLLTDFILQNSISATAIEIVAYRITQKKGDNFYG